MEKRISVSGGNIDIADNCRTFCDIGNLAAERIEEAFRNRPQNGRIELVELDIVCPGIKMLVDKDFRCTKECQALLSVRAYDINASQVDSFELPPPSQGA